MTPRKPSHAFLAQAETLLIYGIFLFLTGLAQLCVTVSHRYITEKTIRQNRHLNVYSFFPATLSMNDIHLWYIYPSATLTIIPFLACVTYTLFKRPAMPVLICISSLISFLSSAIYVGLLIVHTLEYWQRISIDHSKTPASSTTTMSPIVFSRVLVPFEEPATFDNLALLITFTLALVQALLSLIGVVISCLWSPCCMNAWPTYVPIPTTSHYAQTTAHRHETPQSATLRSVKRQQHQETHRFIAPNGHVETIPNSILHKNATLRSHYDDV